MKLHNALHRTCVIIPLLNGVKVCGVRSPRARCAGYFQYVVLYTIVKYSTETWIHHFQPDSKAKNKVWVSSEGDRPVIARRCKTSNRMLYAIFFDSKGPVLQIPVPKGSSVTGKF